MTKREELARQLVIAEIVSAQGITKKRGEALLKELEEAGVIRFTASGDFGLKVLAG
ncbi:hypothetical protein NKE67_02090 [Streptococcus suis]|uniref:hypothetical protein n=1 Tax=Streptococcus suis TaxID=1307 RepID=UPI00209B22AA|nr:hypothetical protein [Streptococcus suis]MCO8221714.1 hypothetical protein [Streptococcus suis]HEM3469282.1 hypothetical protein [Streptococcus suis]